MKNKIIFLLGTIIILFFISNCTDSLNIPPEELNNLPKVTLSSSVTELKPSDTTRIVCKVTDKDKIDSVFRYKFYFEGEEISKTKPTLQDNERIWKAPEKEGAYSIFVEVKDHISTVKDTLVIIVQKELSKPAKPFNPTPKNNSINVPVFTKLRWEVLKQSKLYQVYLGTDSVSLKFYDTVNVKQEIEVADLKYNTKYFWQVKSLGDADSLFNFSDVWSFTTRNEIAEGDPSKLEFVKISEGKFTKGKNDDTLTIGYPYEIMKYEVTNKEYKEYLEKVLGKDSTKIKDNNLMGFYDGDESYPEGEYIFASFDKSSKIKYSGNTFTIEAGYENHPVTNVSWFGARAFARYYKCFLPTFDEWEKAARGLTGNNFPWGDEIDSSRANYLYDTSKGTSTLPVGSYSGKSVNNIKTIDSPSPYGCYDMAGNAWEWTNRRRGNANLVAGGAYNMPKYAQYSYEAFAYQASICKEYIGFRIVKRSE